MRYAKFISAAVFGAAIVVGCAHAASSPRHHSDADLRQRLIGEWIGSRRVDTNQVVTWKTVAHSDGTFWTEDSTRDNSGRLLHFVRMDGTFVVTNGAVVVTFTKSTEDDKSLPRTIRPEPIVRVDDHELVIITETGQESVSQKVSR